MNSKIILISIFSTIILSGCGREESPAWFMTKSDDEINSHFRQVCIDYGYKAGTPDLNRCIRQERKASFSESADRLDKAAQGLQDMDRRNRGVRTNCTTFGNTINCRTRY
jgi:hypothetical protein